MLSIPVPAQSAVAAMREVGAALLDGRFGPCGAAVAGLKVTLRESPNAWASFDAPVGDAPEPEPPSSFAGMGG